MRGKYEEEELIYFNEDRDDVDDQRRRRGRLLNKQDYPEKARNMLMTRMRQAVTGGGGGGGSNKEEKARREIWDIDRRRKQKEEEEERKAFLQHQESIKRREVTYDEDVWARQASSDFSALKLRHMQESEGTTQVSGDDYGELPIIESEEEESIRAVRAKDKYKEPRAAVRGAREKYNVIDEHDKEEEGEVEEEEEVGRGEEVEEEVGEEEEDDDGIYAYAYDKRYLRQGRGDGGEERIEREKKKAADQETEEEEEERRYFLSVEKQGRREKSYYPYSLTTHQRGSQVEKTHILPVKEEEEEGEEEEEEEAVEEGEEIVEHIDDEEGEYEREEGEEEQEEGEEEVEAAEYVEEEQEEEEEEIGEGANVVRRYGVKATEEGEEIAADDDAWQLDQEEEEEEENEEREEQIEEGKFPIAEEQIEKEEEEREDEENLDIEAEDREHYIEKEEEEVFAEGGEEGEEGQYYYEEEEEVEQPLEEVYEKEEEEEENVVEPDEGEEEVVNVSDEVEKEEHEDLTPYELSQIESLVEVRQVPGKGRCLYTRHALEPGAIIFIETPIFVATPSADPELWDLLEKMNEEEAFELPPVWHMGAICTLTQLDEEKKRICLDKWVPEPNKPAGYDVLRVLERTGLPLHAQLYERMLMVWRYNSFGHHSEQPGLVLYNRISMMAHSCSASACWHYGEEDAFILRARIRLNAGEELTISYIGDEDLFKSSDVRREKVNGWLFTCYCQRCSLPVDNARGFRCSACATGTMFFKIDDGVTTSSACTVCQTVPSEDIINYYLEFERAYVERLSETDKSDLADAKLVYFQAQRVFTQHWVLYQLHTILFEGHRDGGDYETAAFHQMERIKYVSQVMPLASYTLAWLHEELGDTLMTKEEHEKKSDSLDSKLSMMSRCFEDAFNLLYILCGKDHDYTIAADTKKTICDKRLEALSAAAQN